MQLTDGCFVAPWQISVEIDPRGHKLWLDGLCFRCAIGGEGGNDIIIQASRALVVERAYRNDKRVVCRGIKVGRATVAGRNHNHNAIKPEDFDCRVYRTCMI